MLNTLGSDTKTIILKTEGGKLSQAFEVAKTKATVTLSGNMVAGDSLNVIVDGKSTGNIAFDTDQATTAAAILAAIVALPSVESATYTALVFTIVPINQVNPAVFSAITHGGAGTATVAVALSETKLVSGQMVKLDTEGKLIPLAAGNPFTTNMGWVMQDAFGGDIVTVVLRGFAILVAQSSINTLLPGPVAYAGFDSATGKHKVTSTSVTASNFVGYALDTADLDEETRLVVA